MAARIITSKVLLTFEESAVFFSVKIWFQLQPLYFNILSLLKMWANWWLVAEISFIWEVEQCKHWFLIDLGRVLQSNSCIVWFEWPSLPNRCPSDNQKPCYLCEHSKWNFFLTWTSSSGHQLVGKRAPFSMSEVCDSPGLLFHSLPDFTSKTY